MKKLIVYAILAASFLFLPSIVHSQNTYELRKLTEDEWLSMSTDERMRALGTGIKNAPNQTFIGDFGRYYEMYRKWGYNFYEMEDRYENYGFRGFENYNLINERRKRWSYNEFGDRITKMTSSGNILSERHFGDGTNWVRNANYFFNQGSATDGVLVARESTNDWAVTINSAGSLRKQFTPLTLSLPNTPGVAIDFQSANTSISTINSLPLLYRGERFRGILLRGGHFRRKLGILTLGATYVNQYITEGTRDKGDSWFGTLNNFTPTPIYAVIRFMDDSPNDNEGGPIIYDVKLKVNGRYREDIEPLIIMDDILMDRTTACISTKYKYYLSPSSQSAWGYENPPAVDLINAHELLPKYIDYMMVDQRVRGINLTTVKKNFNADLAESYYTRTGQGNKPLHVNGTKTAVYLFDLGVIPEKVNSLEATVTVANDYKIQTTSIYEKLGEGGHLTNGDVSVNYDALYWRTMAQADGNIKDGSNIRTIKLNFGHHVASLMYGFNADFNYRGFKIRGEYVTNSSHYMWADGIPGTGKTTTRLQRLPARTGHKWIHRDNAYYITTQKNWATFGFTGELFKIGKFYRPYLDYYLGSMSNYPKTEAPYVLNRNNITRFPLIEDNDDNDEFPDTDYIARQSYYRQANLDDPDGVFPGNDADHDGLPDNNKNQNTIPDYLEPFLMFDSVPDEFVFGDDFNNNTIPDFREDDMKFDTPYDLNRQGYHYFFRYTPQVSINFIAGSMRTQGVGGEYRSWDDYFKFKIDYDVFDIGKINAEYRYEEIQDNIRDPFVKVSTIEKGQRASEARVLSMYERELYFDELEYMNSKVNRLYLDSRIRAIPSITFENLIKFEKNNQVDGYTFDNVYQPNDAINTFAMVNKIMYTKSFGNFIFSPGINLRFYKKARSESVQPLDHYLMNIPLVMFKYLVSPQSTISLGLQGIPHFEFNYKDYIQTENDYKSKTYTVEFANRSVYFGYNVWASVGVTFEQLMYDEDYRDFEDYKSSYTFLRLLLGW